MLFQRNRLIFNPKSLEVIWGQGVPDLEQTQPSMRAGGELSKLKAVNGWRLGAVLDPAGNTRSSVTHRLNQATKAYSAHAKSLNCRRASMALRVQAFHDSSGECATYSAGTWRVCKGTLYEVKIER